jgi:RNase P subunit RPR2
MNRYDIAIGKELPKSFCGMCQEMKPGVETRRQNTQYADDPMNYVTCCEDCFKETQEYWAERWADYNSSRF